MAKKKTPYELREEARKIELEEAHNKCQERIKERNKFEEETGIEVYTSDDYCGLVSGDMVFYYGYEETYCPIKSHKKDCEDYGCEKREWCFVVSKKGKEIMRIPASKIHPENGEEPFWYLVAGIGHYLKTIKECKCQ